MRKLKEEIGKVNTVFISQDEKGAVTKIIVKLAQTKNSERIIFSGSTTFSEDLKTHLLENIIPQTDVFLKAFDISLYTYELSVVNLSAVSSSELKLTVSGFSLDISVFLAIISAGLKLPIRDDIVFTGHLSSSDGNIGQVYKLSEKCEAILEDKSITTFVYPDIDNEPSYKIHKPREYENVQATLRSLRGRVKLVPVIHINDLLKSILTNEALVLAALQSNYFSKQLTHKENPFAVSFLSENLETNFWNVLRDSILKENIDKSHELLFKYSNHFINQKKYPYQMGEKLFKLVASTPPYLTQIPGMFPLMGEKTFRSITKYASEDEIEDVALLGEVLYKTASFGFEEYRETIEIPTEHDEEKLLNYILRQIDIDYIEEGITRKYDDARISFLFNKNKVDTHEEFLEMLIAFYTHLSNNIPSLQGGINKDDIGADALALFQEVFPLEIKFNMGYAQALEGSGGGLRNIFDQIINYMKEKVKEEHITSVINKFIDPLDYDLKKLLIVEIIKREPIDLSNIADETLLLDRMIKNYERVIRIVASSKENYKNIFKYI